MVGIEIDMVVRDCIAALDFYEKIFDIEIVEKTSHARGSNEAVFNMYGTRFHLLDENQQFALLAPQPGQPHNMWVNVLVSDVRKIYANAMALGCTELSPIAEIPEFGVVRAIFMDTFGYPWMLHEIQNR